MLTPTQIKSYSFRSAGKGTYHADEVDEFISDIAKSYEKMFTENGDLLNRLSTLANTVDKYHKDQELIQKTLLIAQRSADELEQATAEKVRIMLDDATKQADEILTAANEKAETLSTEADKKVEAQLSAASIKADKILSNARDNADNLLSDAKQRADKQNYETAKQLHKDEQEIFEMKRIVRDFKISVLSQYSEHIKAIEALPDTIDENLKYPMPQAPVFPEPKAEPVEEAVAAEPIEEAPVEEEEPVVYDAPKESTAAVPAEKPANTATITFPDDDEEEDDEDSFPTLEAVTDFLNDNEDETTEQTTGDAPDRDGGFRVFLEDYIGEDDEDDEEDLLSLARGRIKRENDDDDDDDDEREHHSRFRGFFKK